MTEEKNEGSKPSDEEDPSIGLMFVALIFLIRAVYYALWYPTAMDIPSGAYILLALVGIFYFMASLGLFFKRAFGYYLAWLLLVIEALLTLLTFRTNPIYGLAGIFLLAAIVHILLKSQKEIKKTDRIDKFIGMGLTLVILIYLAVCVYAQVQPL